MSRRYFLPLVILAGLLPRVYLLFRFRSVLIDSDEAVVGLMARHVLHGEFPVFYWGQHYMGTLEVFVNAFVFLLIGPTPLALKLSAMLWFVAFVVVHYCLALAVTDRRTAGMATILVAVSPAFFTVWTMKSRGGYMALLLLGTLALLLAVRLLDSGYTRKVGALLGLALGLAWWSHFLALLYIVPIGVVLLLKDERRFFKSGTAVALAGGFLVGSMPVWVYNLAHHWASFADTKSLQQTGLLADQRGFFRTALPIVLGWRRNWNQDDLFWHAGLAAIGLVMLCFTVLAARYFWKTRAEQFSGTHLLLIFAGGYPFLFSCSGFAWFVDEPRYLLPVYSCLFILLLLWPKRQAARVALFSLLLATAIAGNLRLRPQELVGWKNYEPNGDLIRYLRESKIDRVFAPYWVAYRLTFESGEEIVCTPLTGELSRYEPHERMVKTSRKAVYVLLNLPGQPPVKDPGVLLRRIGNYEVYGTRSTP